MFNLPFSAFSTQQVQRNRAVSLFLCSLSDFDPWLNRVPRAEETDLRVSLQSHVYQGGSYLDFQDMELILTEGTEEERVTYIQQSTLTIQGKQQREVAMRDLDWNATAREARARVPQLLLADMTYLQVSPCSEGVSLRIRAIVHGLHCVKEG